MKSKLYSTFSFFVLFILLTQLNVRAEQMTIYFPVLGNCYLCKLRIEEAVNRLDGIDSVDWSYDTKITTVTYDDGVVDAYIMMHAIADVGHDTEWFPAPDSSYNTLIGTCCEYERTNDYTNVEIGYLSLMDLWVFPVGIEEQFEIHDLKVYPTAGTGIFNFDLGVNTSLSAPEIEVFSMSGLKVYSQRIPENSKGSVDLHFLANGQYIIILRDDNNFMARSKLIKL